MSPHLLAMSIILVDVDVQGIVVNPAEVVVKWDVQVIAAEAVAVPRAKYHTVLNICLFKVVCLLIQTDSFSL